MLGKYVDGDNRTKVDLSPEFWRFDIDPASPPHGRWTKICANTAVCEDVLGLYLLGKRAWTTGQTMVTDSTLSLFFFVRR